MANQCRIEFYFKRADLEKLLKQNPDAKGIIISQEINKEKPKGSEHYVNVAHIRARADHGTGVQKLATAADGGGDVYVDGCPYPPGCN